MSSISVTSSSSNSGIQGNFSCYDTVTSGIVKVVMETDTPFPKLVAARLTNVNFKSDSNDLKNRSDPETSRGIDRKFFIPHFNKLDPSRVNHIMRHINVASFELQSAADARAKSSNLDLEATLSKMSIDEDVKALSKKTDKEKVKSGHLLLKVPSLGRLSRKKDKKDYRAADHIKQDIQDSRKSMISSQGESINSALDADQHIEVARSHLDKVMDISDFPNDRCNICGKINNE